MELRDLLRPWDNAFVNASISYSHQDETLWFAFGAKRMAEVAVVHAVEGLELLTWLRLVSVEAFEATISPLRSRYNTARSIVQVGVFIDTAGHGREAVSACFLTRTQKRSPSDACVAARQVLQQHLQAEGEGRGGIPSAPPPKIPVHIRLGGADQMSKRSMRCIVDFARIQSEVLAEETERWFRLRIAQLDYNHAKYYPVDEKRFLQLTELATRGVTLVNCRQPEFEISNPVSARDTFLGLQSLLETNGSVGNGVETRVPVANFVLNPACLDLGMAPRICSAIADSRSLRQVSVDVHESVGDPRCLRSVMQWVGFALFSRFAGHTIQRVDFDVGLDRIEFLEGLLDMLESRDPLANLFMAHGDSIKSHERLRATASRFALLCPTMKDMDDCAIVETREHTELRIISHEQDWWSVLLPAWGRAWVHDRDISITDVEAEHSSKTRELEVSAIDDELLEIVTLIEGIGPAGTRLTLDIQYRDAPSCESRVVSVVPTRRVLRFLRAEANRLGRLADVFRSVTLQRSCDVVELFTDCYDSKYGFPLSPTFIRALADSDHPLYQCLESLNVETPRLDQATKHELCAQLIQVLDHNNRLVTLNLNLYTYANDGGDGALKEALLARHGVVLGATPLELRERLAFLSVLASGESTASRMGFGRYQLDSAIVATIFQFATRFSIRKVHAAFVVCRGYYWNRRG